MDVVKLNRGRVKTKVRSDRPHEFLPVAPRFKGQSFK
jgi:hypothetical protein